MAFNVPLKCEHIVVIHRPHLCDNVVQFPCIDDSGIVPVKRIFSTWCFKPVSHSNTTAATSATAPSFIFIVGTSINRNLFPSDGITFLDSYKYRFLSNCHNFIRYFWCTYSSYKTRRIKRMRSIHITV